MNCKELDVKFLCRICASEDKQVCLIERWNNYFREYFQKDQINLALIEIIKDNFWYSRPYMEKALEVSYPEYYQKYKKLLVLK